MSAAFGVVGLIGIALFAVDSAMYSVFALLTFVTFALLIGWKVFRLAKIDETSAIPSPA
ncbi:MAG: hypothetical protein L3K04_01785 [Thermoplasmata archaeon]|nr:hypothetical protein [Thermoplasmata archaeon]